MALEDDTEQLGAGQMQRLQKGNQRNWWTRFQLDKYGFSNLSPEPLPVAQAHSNPSPSSFSQLWGWSSCSWNTP